MVDQKIKDFAALLNGEIKLVTVEWVWIAVPKSTIKEFWDDVEEENQMQATNPK